ncbi:hypothetical protein [Fredinandcohnia quinoae]|uniref:Uncharacterized protein n=1 Tax=Fredinandcohnia quinoae TaxID=2918902 RepID=A0AAW5EFZ8_9BACI|nr:hypothetical protein [Fredinandcohnia sp. SECRCQ15]MCH1627774.1 hypothetical protein [Fredinandcohnia sp. SECRCQ15]
MKKILLIGIIFELALFIYIYNLKIELARVVNDVPSKQLNIAALKLADVSQFFEGENNAAVTVTATAQITLQELKSTYRPQFDELEEETKATFNKIVQDALGNNSQSEEKTLGLSSFTSLINELRTLEKKTDEAFNSLYRQLEDELTTAGYSTDEAIEFKTNYEKSKKEQIKKMFEDLNHK